MRTIKKIICAVDLAGFTPVVAEYAVMFAKNTGAELVVIYVAPSLTQYAAFEVQPKALESFIEDISGEASKNMQDVIAKYFCGVKAEGKVVVGYPADEIIKTAENENADMIIMGTHAHKGLQLIMFGSVADKVVKNASVPVLTIRPQK